MSTTNPEHHSNNDETYNEGIGKTLRRAATDVADATKGIGLAATRSIRNVMESERG